MGKVQELNNMSTEGFGFGVQQLNKVSAQI